jgi:hypothetical protein
VDLGLMDDVIEEAEIKLIKMSEEGRGGPENGQAHAPAMLQTKIT